MKIRSGNMRVLALLLLAGTAWATPTNSNNFMTKEVGTTSKITVTHKDKTYISPIAAGEHCGWTCFMQGFEAGELGMCDALLTGMTHTVARESWAEFTTGYFTNEWGVLGKNDAVVPLSKADLNGADVTIVVQADTTHSAAAGACKGVPTTGLSDAVCDARMKEGAGTPEVNCNHGAECAWTAGDFDDSAVIFVFGECRTCDGATCSNEASDSDGNNTCGGNVWKKSTCESASGTWTPHAEISSTIAKLANAGLECHKKDHAVWVSNDAVIVQLFKGETTLTHPTHGANWAADTKTYMVQDEAYVATIGSQHSADTKKVFNFPLNEEVAENFGTAVRKGAADADLVGALNMAFKEVMEDSNQSDTNVYGAAWNNYFAGGSSNFGWDKCTNVVTGSADQTAAQCTARLVGKQGHNKAACELNAKCEYAKSSLVDDSGTVTWPATPTSGRLFDVLECREFTYCLDAWLPPWRFHPIETNVVATSSLYPLSFDYEIGNAVLAKIADHYPGTADACCAAGTCGAAPAAVSDVAVSAAQTTAINSIFVDSVAPEGLIVDGKLTKAGYNELTAAQKADIKAKLGEDATANKDIIDAIAAFEAAYDGTTDIPEKSSAAILSTGAALVGLLLL